MSHKKHNCKYYNETDKKFKIANTHLLFKDKCTICLKNYYFTKCNDLNKYLLMIMMMFTLKAKLTPFHFSRDLKVSALK